jgi:predicted PurR-regulated permease PerM
VSSARHSGSGPIVWSAIIAGTCILLFLLQKVLWLVVPFLLALILYHLLFPVLTWLMYRGLKRSEASAALMVVLILSLVAGLVILLPWVTDHLVDWQALLERYLQGGFNLFDKSLRGLESSWSVLAHAHLADKLGVHLSDLSDHAEQYLQPVVTGILAWAPSLMLAPFVTFFILRDGGHFQRMLGAAVPNAFFEKTLDLLHEVDQTTRAYFVGLIKLTLLDTATLAVGLWWMGMPSPLALGLVCAVLAWLPYLGSILGGILVVLVAATDFPDAPRMAYGAIALFLLVRMLDDFIYMPLTIGKSLHIHPLVTVTMIFVGGAVAGISGLMLVLPLLGVVMVIGETIGKVVTDPRLLARYRHARVLRDKLANLDLS